MSVLETIIISSMTTSLGFLFFVLRLHVKEKSATRAELELKKRQAFQKMLDEHSEIVLGLFFNKPIKDWQKDFSEMSKGILSWGSDEVLGEYGKYVELYSTEKHEIQERELHFANAILAFRKELGYKNKKGKITPEQIVHIFRCGLKNSI